MPARLSKSTEVRLERWCVQTCAFIIRNQIRCENNDALADDLHTAVQTLANLNRARYNILDLEDAVGKVANGHGCDIAPHRPNPDDLPPGKRMAFFDAKRRAALTRIHRDQEQVKMLMHLTLKAENEMREADGIDPINEERINNMVARALEEAHA